MKPLTPERRAEIEKIATTNGSLVGLSHSSILDMLLTLLADSDYWRNAVKSANPYSETKDGKPICVFCKCQVPTEPHKPDCPWLKAQ